MAKFESDLTKGNVWKQLVIFAIPFFVSNLIQSVYSVADMMIVSRFGGMNSVAGVNVSGQIMLIVMNVAGGIATGGTVMVGQFLGAGLRDKIKESISTIFITLLTFAAFLTIVIQLFKNPILDALNTPSEAYQEAYYYLLICAAGIIFIFGYNALSSVMIGMGDGKTPLKFVSIACVANIVLDLLFVGAFHWGAAGAAAATVIAQAFSVIACVVYLTRQKFIFDFRLSSFTFHQDLFQTLMKVGVPNCFWQITTDFSFLILTALINSVGGVAANAAAGMVGKFNGFALLPQIAISTSVGAMISQNMGAGNIKRVKKATYYGMILCAGVSVVIFLVARLFPTQIFGLFGAEAEVVDKGLIYMNAFSFEYVFLPFVVSLNAVFIGTGNGWVILISDIIAAFLIRIPLAYYLGTAADLGLFGIGCAVPAATLVTSLVLSGFYLSGCWKKSMIIKK